MSWSQQKDENEEVDWGTPLSQRTQAASPVEGGRRDTRFAEEPPRRHMTIELRLLRLKKQSKATANQEEIKNFLAQGKEVEQRINSMKQEAEAAMNTLRS